MSERAIAFICMSASIILSSAAQLSMKVSMVLLADAQGHSVSLFQLLFDPNVLTWLVLGLFCYAVSLVFWLFAIARLDLSLAYPMLSLSYVLVYLVAINWPLLSETFSWTRSLGILIVAAGVILIARSDRHNRITDPE